MYAGGAERALQETADRLDREVAVVEGVNGSVPLSFSVHEGFGGSGAGADEHAPRTPR
jgi:hypothetical protein